MNRYASWPDRQLVDAVQVYASEYSPEELAAIQAELDGRGIDPSALREERFLIPRILFAYLCTLVLVVITIAASVGLAGEAKTFLQSLEGDSLTEERVQQLTRRVHQAAVVGGGAAIAWILFGPIGKRLKRLAGAPTDSSA